MWFSSAGDDHGSRVDGGFATSATRCAAAATSSIAFVAGCSPRREPRRPARRGAPRSRHAAGVVRVQRSLSTLSGTDVAGGQARHVGDHSFASRSGRVPDRPGEASAVRRERLEAGRLEEPGRADVPRLVNHEQLSVAECKARKRARRSSATGLGQERRRIVEQHRRRSRSHSRR